MIKFTLAAAIGLFAILPASADIKVKDGEKIAFLGDSITQAGNRGNGYIQLAMKALKEEGLNVTHIPAGIGGHKSNDMLNRLDSDVLSKNPDWMFLSCGVNDVWHFSLVFNGRTFEGVSLEDFKKNITEIVEQAEKKKIKVVIMTASMISEDPEFKLNKDLEPYNEFLRELAKEKNLPLAEINKAMHEALSDIPDVKGKGSLMGEPTFKRDINNKLTGDGVHMNKEGNIMMAKEVLRSLGMSESKIMKAAKSW